MRSFTIHGYPATLSADGQWSCNEALVEKFLRRECTGATPEESIVRAAKEFPGVMHEVVVPDADAPAA